MVSLFQQMIYITAFHIHLVPIDLFRPLYRLQAVLPLGLPYVTDTLELNIHRMSTLSCPCLFLSRSPIDLRLFINTYVYVYIFIFYSIPSESEKQPLARVLCKRKHHQFLLAALFPPYNTLLYITPIATNDSSYLLHCLSLLDG